MDSEQDDEEIEDMSIPSEATVLDQPMMVPILKPPASGDNMDPRQATLLSNLPARETVQKHLSSFSGADWHASLWCLTSTLVACMCSSWILVWIVMDHRIAQIGAAFHAAAAAVALVLAALCRVRLFVIFHDCIHSAFMPSHVANVLLGFALGSVCWTAFGPWQRGHLYHHTNSNNLSRCQVAQSSPWTFRQFERASPPSQFAYLVENCTFVYYILRPPFLFVVANRLAACTIENLGLTIFLLFTWRSAGFQGIVLEIATVTLYGSIGHVLFHLQHTFDGSYKATGTSYSRYANCFLGCSYLDLPRWIKWFTLGIEYHHIHHLEPRVPCYRLEQCHLAAPQLWAVVPKLQPLGVLRTLHFSLYDDEAGKYLSVLSLQTLKILMGYCTSWKAFYRRCIMRQRVVRI